MAARTDSDRLLEQFRTLIPQIRQGSIDPTATTAFTTGLNQTYTQLKPEQQKELEKKIQDEIRQRQDLSTKEKGRVKKWFEQKLFGLAFAKGFISIIERMMKQKLKLQKWARMKANFLKRLKSKRAQAKLQQEFEKQDSSAAKISEKEQAAYAEKIRREQIAALLRYEPIAFTAAEEAKIKDLSSTITDNILKSQEDLCAALELENPISVEDQNELQTSVTELETGLQQVEKGLEAGHFDMDNVPNNLMTNLGEKLYAFNSKLDDMYDSFENKLKDTGQATPGKLAALDQWYEGLQTKVLGNWLGQGQQTQLSDTERAQNKQDLQATAQGQGQRSETVQAQAQAQTQNPYAATAANQRQGLFFGAAGKQTAFGSDTTPAPAQEPAASPAPESEAETAPKRSGTFAIPKVPKAGDKPTPT